MLRVVYYSGVTENTHRFVTKLKIDPGRISRIVLKENLPEISDPYILILPTYADAEGRHAIQPSIMRFLKIPLNASLIRGVVASGNTNFGKMFAVAADQVSQLVHTPIVHKFELFGMPSDVAIVKARIDQQ